VCVLGLTELFDANSVLEIGHDERVTASSNMNKEPSNWPQDEIAVAYLDCRDSVGSAFDRELVVVESS
jgi:hypothetical protein